jgi:hypothetical protein
MQITTEMAKDPEVFSRNVDVLTRHCLRVSLSLLYLKQLWMLAQSTTDTGHVHTHAEQPGDPSGRAQPPPVAVQAA